MKKTKVLSLLLAVFLLLSSLTLPLLAVDAETAEDPEQTQSDGADAAAADDSVPEDQLLSSRTSFSVAAKAALLVDLNTGRTVYEQDADERIYPASLTKIMTCLLALENGNLSDVVTVSASALEDLDIYSSVAGLQVGEQMTLENLLYCMMVVSGNDACNVIAEHIAGSITDFVRMMNQRAYELGCLNTHFSNPHGLHDECHYTTARDLSIITQAALKSENFRQIVDTYEYQLPDDNVRQNIPKLKTTNMLIYRSMSNSLYYSRAHGIKTGYTSQAGRCVISEATGDGLDLLGIVCGAATTILDSGDLLMENFTECARLFDYGFDNYSYLPIMSPLYPVDQVKINNSAGAEAVAVAPQDEIKVLLPNDYDPDKLVTDIQLNSDSVDAPVREGDVLGSATVTYAGEILGQTKLLAITDVARSEISSAAAGTGAYIQKNWWKWVVIAIFVAVGVILALIVLYQLRKRRYRRMRMEQRRRALGAQTAFRVAGRILRRSSLTRRLPRTQRVAVLNGIGIKFVAAVVFIERQQRLRLGKLRLAPPVMRRVYERDHSVGQRRQRERGGDERLVPDEPACRAKPGEKRRKHPERHRWPVLFRRQPVKFTHITLRLVEKPLLVHTGKRLRAIGTRGSGCGRFQLRQRKQRSRLLRKRQQRAHHVHSARHGRRRGGIAAPTRTVLPDAERAVGLRCEG